MNEEMEQLLRNQQLRKPGASLDARIHRTLSVMNPRWSTIGMWFFPTALAASVALAVLIQPAPHVTDPSSHAFTDASGGLRRVDEVTSQITPGELLLSTENDPVQPIRVRNVYQSRWFDEDSNTYYEMTVPDEQVVLVSAPVY